MQHIGVVRLGKDAEIRYMPDGSPVANLALAYNYGKKDADGKRPTQWIDAAIFGERAEKLKQYLLKGQQLLVHIDNLHIETYPKNGGGEGFKMVGIVAHLEFVGNAPTQQQGAPARQAAPAAGSTRPAVPAQRPAPNFSDMDDDIPF